MWTSVFMATLRRDLQMALATPVEWIQAWLFFLVVVALVPLTAQPDPALLRQLAPSAIWAGALFAVALTLPRLFSRDLGDGTLEQATAGAVPLTAYAAARLLSTWLAIGPILALACLPLAVLYGLDAHAAQVLSLAVLLGTPTLVALGGFAAALAVGLRSAPVLTAVLGFPLFVPVMVFGAGASQAVHQGLPAGPHLLLTAALIGPAGLLAPLACAAALRVAVQSHS